MTPIRTCILVAAMVAVACVCLLPASVCNAERIDPRNTSTWSADLAASCPDCAGGVCPCEKNKRLLEKHPIYKAVTKPRTVDVHVGPVSLDLNRLAADVQTAESTAQAVSDQAIRDQIAAEKAAQEQRVYTAVLIGVIVLAGVVAGVVGFSSQVRAAPV